MKSFARMSLLATAALAAAMAHAAITYDVLQANIVYDNGDTNALDAVVNGNNITFSSTPDMMVGSDSGHNSAVVTIIYTATSDTAINGINLNFSGQVSNFADIGYKEVVKQWDPVHGEGAGTLAEAAGNYDGSGFGGSDDPFNNNSVLTFSSSANTYLVKKSFFLSDLDSNPTNSSASLGSVEQAVPEPASMSALAFGALGLLTRRRRK